MDAITALSAHGTAEIFDKLTDDGFCICEIVQDDAGNPIDYRFLAVNSRFSGMTGLKDPVGRTARELIPNLEHKWIEAYGRVALKAERLRFREGSDALGLHLDVFAAPTSSFGQFALLFRDVTEMHRIETERERALEFSRKLLEEINHRVMNSLNTMSALTSMEIRDLADTPERSALSRVRDRIKALAELYSSLNRTASVDRVEARSYLGGVLQFLRSSIGPNDGVEISSEFAAMQLDTRSAVPLGLILNELVTNALKYAFANQKSGSIRVTLTRDGDACLLKVSDDGSGISSAPNNGSGVGRKLIDAFVLQLQGRLEIASGARGTCVRVYFPAPSLDAQNPA
ncbi:sensor histidine kinase [Profundibacterium mesophilum]|uniref:histidine kinase n=1 Tax=Profundibacterium mesophilum KAUST100406-0324 TaxID=1037889 RepID=A0A921NS37_9RHOB|nr:sensor histidine kinase [Profundibacterium mesophilum]KAF0676772.1 Two component sensor kinase [Profundibacterium mesophilum KAUST100406-0324]